MESRSKANEFEGISESIGNRLLDLILLPGGLISLALFAGRVFRHDSPLRSAPSLLLACLAIVLRFSGFGHSAMAKTRIVLVAFYLILVSVGWQIGTFRAPGQIGLASILVAWLALFLPRRQAWAGIALLVATNAAFAWLIHTGRLVEALVLPADVALFVLSGTYVILFITISAPIRMLQESIEASRRAEQATKDAMAELQNSRNFTIQAVDRSLHSFGWLTVEGQLRFVNATALELIHARLEDVQGRFYWETPWFEHDEEARGTLRKAIARAASGETVRYDTTQCTSDGRIRDVDFSVHPILDESGAVSMLVAEARDTTDERESLRQRERLSEQLHQSQKMEVVGQLAGGVAHDFNNSLTSISGLAQVLQAGNLDESARTKFLDMILETTGNASRSIQRLLRFSRRNERKPDVLVDLVAIVNDAANILRSTQDKRVSVTVEQDSDVAPVPGDESMLQNALLNMGINAFHAMPTGGVLRFRVRNEVLSAEAAALLTPPVSAGEYVEIAIQDTGCGMPPEVARRIFEPFFTTKEPGKGTGLGMSMVLATLTELGGSIAVASEKGNGTTFRVYMPKAVID